jgi:plastocyanin
MIDMNAALPGRATTASRRPRARRFAVLAATLVLAQTALVAAAAEAIRISQKGRAFNVKAITINAGDTVHFGNDDEFIHQIFVKSDDFNFDSDESSPGDTIDLRFTKQGTFAVHCHIHPKMELIVTVK